MHDLRFSDYLNKSLSYHDYVHYFHENTVAFKEGIEVVIPYAETLPLNWQRHTRNEKTFKLSIELEAVLDKLKHKVIWLVISEPWCGDAAQCLPGICRIAEASNGKIDVHIVLRDTHLLLMDHFLTNGARSIPKLIQLNQSLEVTGTWGPRPKTAHDLVVKLKSDPSTEDTYKDALHRWYADDKMQSLQTEIQELIQSVQ